MASGLVCRANRPNTWLHRPSLRREVFPCQLGAVHTWHDSEVQRRRAYVRSLGSSGKHVLTASLTGFDPDVWSGRALQEASSTWLMRSCINVSGL
jgi:hypothetical protein